MLIELSDICYTELSHLLALCVYQGDTGMVEGQVPSHCPSWRTCSRLRVSTKLVNVTRQGRHGVALVCGNDFAARLYSMSWAYAS